ncbi:MAG: hypothetical protein VXY74_02275, partial [SAR324 cluster bacterium]|nr:hypothetical protein [SAR324 cluster bacterium]
PTGVKPHSEHDLQCAGKWRTTVPAGSAFMPDSLWPINNAPPLATMSWLGSDNLSACISRNTSN